MEQGGHIFVIFTILEIIKQFQKTLFDKTIENHAFWNDFCSWSLVQWTDRHTVPPQSMGEKKDSIQLRNNSNTRKLQRRPVRLQPNTSYIRKW